MKIIIAVLSFTASAALVARGIVALDCKQGDFAELWIRLTLSMIALFIALRILKK